MNPFLSQELTNYVIFENRLTGEFYAIENSIWDKKYRYDERRLKNDDVFFVEAMQIVLDPLKNEYVATKEKKIIKYNDLKAVLVQNIF